MNSPYVPAARACVNSHTGEYYASSSNNFYIFNTITETVEPHIELPINATDGFTLPQYNPCDSMLYGIIFTQTSKTFAKYDFETGTMATVSELDPNQIFCWDCMSAIDPVDNIFYFRSPHLIGIDMDTGEILHNTPIVNNSDENFGHIALKCGTHEIFVTAAKTEAMEKRLANVDPYTGVVSHVADEPWEEGFWKPVIGGDAINQDTGDYFYSGAGGVLVRVNTETGIKMDHHLVDVEEIYFVQHFSQCECEPTVDGVMEDEEMVLEVFPNPFAGFLKISSSGSETSEVRLIDVSGKQLYGSSFSGGQTLITSQLVTGAYICEVQDQKGSIRQISLIKE